MKNQVLIVTALLILSSVAAQGQPYETGYKPSPQEIYFPCKQMFWDNITCLQCWEGFTLGKNATCYANKVTNCLYYTSEGRCGSCRYPLHPSVDGGSCDRVLTVDVPDAPLCQVFDRVENLCKKCIKTYKIDLRFGSCSAMIPNCEAQGGKYCVKCFQGFYLLNNICHDVSYSCESREKSGSCAKCRNGYTFVEGICLEQNYQPIKGCIQYLANPYMNDGRCRQCRYPLVPYLNDCLPQEVAIARMRSGYRKTSDS